jgi:hypothetical protein
MPSKSGAGFDKNPHNINRNGRPRKCESFTYFLWEVLGEKEISFKGQKISGKEAVARKALELALKGDMTAIKYIMDRLDGTPFMAKPPEDEPEQKGDPDLIRYKIHSRAFDMQQRVLMSKAKDIGLMCGRRAGKSEVNKFMALGESQAGDARKVLIIGLTIGKTQQIYEQDILKLAEKLGLAAKKNSVHGWIEFENKSLIQFGGTSSKVEKEKYRGQFWDLIIIDEAQSQPGLGAFLQEVINPMLVDRNGTLVMSGSGPRTRGTYWERFYLNPSPSGLRLNWNLSHNPYIHDYQHALDLVREKYGYTETDPLYQREYLGLPVYDDDALVLRMAGENYWQPADIENWIANQSPDDIRFVSGLDYGVRDSDAFVIVMYSEKRNEKFVVYEHKANGQDISQLKEAIDAGIKYINESPLFAPVYRKAFDIYADTSDTKISMELRNRYGLPILPAYKHDKALAIQMLQDEVRRRFLRIPSGGVLDDESLKTVFRRVEIDGQPSILTREIDDDLYHPDMMDAVLYALRGYWLTHQPEHHGESSRPMQDMTPELETFIQAKPGGQGQQNF